MVQKSTNPFAAPGKPAASPASAPLSAGLPPAPDVMFAAPDAFGFEEIDLSGIESTAKIEPGTYPMYLESVEPSRSQSGNPMLVWRFRIFDHPQYSGRQFAMYTVTTASALWKLRQVADALGLPSKFTPGPHLHDIIVVGQVIDDSYDGKDRSTLDTVFAAPAYYGGPGARRS
jgi:hypothetical protein